MAFRRSEERKERLKIRYLRDSSNPMDIPDPGFIALYRLNKEGFSLILEVIASHLGSSSIPAKIQLAAALRFLAVGSFQAVLANDMYLSMARTTLCKILWKVINAIEENICPSWIYMEMNASEISASKLHFYQKHGIPGVVGCVDGTHVRLIKPCAEESLYYNRKGYFSLNVMVVCDYQMKIRAVDSSRPGSCHDAFIWGMSDAKIHYAEMYERYRNCWLLGDSGYGLEPYLITPYKNPQFNSNQHRFNKLHCSARNIVERNLKSRFRCLQMTLHYEPKKVVKIVNVCCALHNVCKHFNMTMDDDIVPIFEEELSVEVEEITRNTEGRAVRDDIARSII